VQSCFRRAPVSQWQYKNAIHTQMAFNKTPPTNTPAHEFKMWAHRAACDENMIRENLSVPE
jgi:hypothetical protein